MLRMSPSAGRKLSLSKTKSKELHGRQALLIPCLDEAAEAATLEEKAGPGLVPAPPRLDFILKIRTCLT